MVACDAPLEPQRHTEPPPIVESSDLETRVWWEPSPPEGVFTVYVIVADAHFRATAEHRFPMEVRATSGDTETMALKRNICGPDDQQVAWLCNGLSFSMHDGHDVRDLYPKLRRLGARFTIRPEIGWYGGFQLFGVPLVKAVDEASGWPGVKVVGYSGVIPNPSLQMTWHEWKARVLSASIRLDVTAPTVGNGIIELVGGDTLTIRYLQADGSLYTRSLYFPPLAQGPGAITVTSVGQGSFIRMVP